MHVHSVYSNLVRTLIQLTGYLKPEHVSPCQSQTYPPPPPLACHSFQVIRTATSLIKVITPMFFLTSTELAPDLSYRSPLPQQLWLFADSFETPPWKNSTSLPFLSPPHWVCSSLSYRHFLPCTVCLCVQYIPVSNSVPVEILTWVCVSFKCEMQDACWSWIFLTNMPYPTSIRSSILLGAVLLYHGANGRYLRRDYLHKLVSTLLPCLSP